MLVIILNVNAKRYGAHGLDCYSAGDRSNIGNNEHMLREIIHAINGRNLYARFGAFAGDRVMIRSVDSLVDRLNRFCRTYNIEVLVRNDPRTGRTVIITGNQTLIMAIEHFINIGILNKTARYRRTRGIHYPTNSEVENDEGYSNEVFLN